MLQLSIQPTARITLLVQPSTQPVTRITLLGPEDISRSFWPTRLPNLTLCALDSGEAGKATHITAISTHTRARARARASTVTQNELKENIRRAVSAVSGTRNPNDFPLICLLGAEA